MNGTLRPQIPAAHRVSIIGLLVTLGIVYGDIGTSPLYVMKAILGATPHPTPQYIIGALSCIIWTLTLQATVKYVLIALRADNKNEGGILALYALVRRSRRKWLYGHHRSQHAGGRRRHYAGHDRRVSHRGTAAH